MREIAKQSGILQALLHYHFRTKERLFDEVIRRRAAAISASHERLVDKLFVENDNPSLEQILGVFFSTSNVARSSSGNVPCSQLMTSVQMRADEPSKAVTDKYLNDIARAFTEAFRICVPGLSLDDAVLGYLLAVGVRAYTHTQNERASRLSGGAYGGDVLEQIVMKAIQFTRVCT
ncbi:TetR/AcrR family transcriptional regulator [Bradyrhizobium diazoefficiens]|uniref:TetR/AcrR family transcriptional regulator n=1 Tax=Bradyrhizobium diazoefficiens TaxID=1355477 RepID=UPI00271458B0|nr:TetR/AcrR family transcriptional regulator [Bradyrhizobium diazoefficiens]WLA53913.1 TetR/AcrR family transcriptional regulator [Bradyrhizobium diazoefficiens]